MRNRHIAVAITGELAMKPRLIISFSPLTEAEFQAKTLLILTKTCNSPDFPLPWPPPVPNPDQLNAAHANYLTAVAEAATRDTLKIRRRNEARQYLTERLQKVAPYLELVADGDIAKLQNTGFDLRQPPSSNASTDPLPAPSDFRVTQGKMPGVLDVHVANQATASSFEIQISFSDALENAEWAHAMTSVSGMHMLLTDLPRGKPMWIRVRGVSLGGYGLWTDPLRVTVY
jgi:hypothetical protein